MEYIGKRKEEHTCFVNLEVGDVFVECVATNEVYMKVKHMDGNDDGLSVLLSGTDFLGEISKVHDNTACIELPNAQIVDRS